MARTAQRARSLSRREASRVRADDAAEASHARAWAAHLIDALGASHALPELDDEHAALTWARSGLMALTGAAQGEPLMCPLPLAACAEGALAALAALAPPGALSELRGAALLAERAAMTGHARQADLSPGSGCRLLQATDGEIALNLSRDADWELLPAWLEQQDCDGSWETLVASRAVGSLVERGRLLGLAVAASPQKFRRAAFPIREKEITAELLNVRFRRLSMLAETVDFSCVIPAKAGIQSLSPSGRWSLGRQLDSRLRGNDVSCSADCRSFTQRATDSRVGWADRGKPPLVVDLSSLWAGPLCSHLLQLCGAEVLKVESVQRPDGARSGSPAFFALLNSDKRSVALDFASARGREQLRALLLRADIVIEASRPRALRQLGIDAEAIVRARGSTWISLSGYGRGEPQEHWVAYGDDAGVAAGLSRVMREVSGRSLFVGDAIADPLTGIHAALVAWASWHAGGARLIPLSLAGVTRECMQFDLPETVAGLRERHRQWTAVWRCNGAVVAAPSSRAARGRAPALGEHTDAVLSALGIRC